MLLSFVYNHIQLELKCILITIIPRHINISFPLLNAAVHFPAGDVAADAGAGRAAAAAAGAPRPAAALAAGTPAPSQVQQAEQPRTGETESASL